MVGYGVIFGLVSNRSIFKVEISSGLQLVGLNTWFKVDDEAWVENVTVSEE